MPEPLYNETCRDASLRAIVTYKRPCNDCCDCGLKKQQKGAAKRKAKAKPKPKPKPKPKSSGHASKKSKGSKKDRSCCAKDKSCPQRIEQMALPLNRRVEYTLQRYSNFFDTERVVKVCRLIHELQNPKPTPPSLMKAKKKKRKCMRAKACCKSAKLKEQWLEKQSTRSADKFMRYLTCLRRMVPNYKQLQVTMMLYKLLNFRKLRSCNRFIKEELKIICQKLGILIDVKLQPYKQEFVVDQISCTTLEDKHCIFQMFKYVPPESEEETELIYEEEGSIFDEGSMYQGEEILISEWEVEEEELSAAGVGGVGEGEEEGEEESEGAGKGEGEGEGEGEEEGEGEGAGVGKGVGEEEGEEGGVEGAEEGGAAAAESSVAFAGDISEEEYLIAEEESLFKTPTPSELEIQGDLEEGEGEEFEEGEGVEGAIYAEGEGEEEEEEAEGEEEASIEGVEEEVIKPTVLEEEEESVMLGASEEEVTVSVSVEPEAEPERHPDGTSSYVDWCLYVSWLKELGRNIEMYANCLQQFREAIAADRASKFEETIRFILKNWSNYLGESRMVDKEMTQYFKDKEMSWCSLCRDCTIDDYPTEHYIPPELAQVIKTTKHWRRLLAEAEEYCQLLTKKEEGEEEEGAEEVDEVYEIFDVGSSSSSSFDILPLDDVGGRRSRSK